MVRVGVLDIDQDPVYDPGQPRKPLLALVLRAPRARAAILRRGRCQQDAFATIRQLAITQPPIGLEQARPLLKAKARQSQSMAAGLSS